MEREERGGFVSLTDGTYDEPLLLLFTLLTATAT